MGGSLIVGLYTCMWDLEFVIQEVRLNSDNSDKWCTRSLVCNADRPISLFHLSNIVIVKSIKLNMSFFK